MIAAIMRRFLMRYSSVDDVEMSGGGSSSAVEKAGGGSDDIPDAGGSTVDNKPLQSEILSRSYSRSLSGLRSCLSWSGSSGDGSYSPGSRSRQQR